jgi:hypothetical protein
LIDWIIWILLNMKLISLHSKSNALCGDPAV